MTTPHVDLSTGKIYGCRKGSREWHHEKAHLIYNNSSWGSELKLWQGYAFVFWMLSITLSVVNKFMLMLSIPLLLYYIGVDIYEEVWCNRYARKHTKN